MDKIIFPLKKPDKNSFKAHSDYVKFKVFCNRTRNDIIIDRINEMVLVSDYSPHRFTMNIPEIIGKGISFKIIEKGFGIEFELEESIVNFILKDIKENNATYEVLYVQFGTIEMYDIKTQFTKEHMSFDDRFKIPINENGTTDFFVLLRNNKYFSKELVTFSKEIRRVIEKSVDNLKLSPRIKKDKIEEIDYVTEKSTNNKFPIFSWEEYFMAVAQISSMRSKDPSTQVGAVIVDSDNRILSIGYNGLPNGCSDNEFPWNSEPENDTEEAKINVKNYYVVHAELNAILNYKGESLKGTTLYVTLIPCYECAKAIIQSGIKKIVYLNFRDYFTNKATFKMLKSAGVEIVQYKNDNSENHYTSMKKTITIGV